MVSEVTVHVVPQTVIIVKKHRSIRANRNTVWHNLALSVILPITSEELGAAIGAPFTVMAAGYRTFEMEVVTVDTEGVR